MSSVEELQAKLSKIEEERDKVSLIAFPARNEILNKC
jgi:hypothetical protein